MNAKKQLMDGLFYQNPVTVQLLGMCSTMAITTTLFNGLGMGVSVLIILTLSNILIAALRKIIPNNIRIACFIVVIAGFVTIVDLMLQAFIPAPVQEPGPVHPPRSWSTASSWAAPRPSPTRTPSAPPLWTASSRAWVTP